MHDVSKIGATPVPPHPTDPSYVTEWSTAWTRSADDLMAFFAPDGSYTDVAMGTTYRGHQEIRKFHRFMLVFAPDSTIEFGAGHAVDGHLTSEWLWSGSVSGPLKLRSGKLVDASGTRFSVPGVAVCSYATDGLLTSHKDYWDLASVLDQTGVPMG